MTARGGPKEALCGGRADINSSVGGLGADGYYLVDRLVDGFIGIIGVVEHAVDIYIGLCDSLAAVNARLQHLAVAAVFGGVTLLDGVEFNISHA